MVTSWVCTGQRRGTTGRGKELSKDVVNTGAYLHFSLIPWERHRVNPTLRHGVSVRTLCQSVMGHGPPGGRKRRLFPYDPWQFSEGGGAVSLQQPTPTVPEGRGHWLTQDTIGNSNSIHPTQHFLLSASSYSTFYTRSPKVP